MNIYLVNRTDEVGYDEYFGIVVVVKNKKDAVKLHPNGGLMVDNDKWDDYSWVSVKDTKKLKITKIGKANKDRKPGIVLVDFKAG